MRAAGKKMRAESATKPGLASGHALWHTWCEGPRTEWHSAISHVFFESSALFFSSIGRDRSTLPAVLRHPWRASAEERASREAAARGGVCRACASTRLCSQLSMVESIVEPAGTRPVEGARPWPTAWRREKRYTRAPFRNPAGEVPRASHRGRRNRKFE